jgi:hypothetical protein
VILTKSHKFNVWHKILECLVYYIDENPRHV